MIDSLWLAPAISVVAPSKGWARESTSLELRKVGKRGWSPGSAETLLAAS